MSALTSSYTEANSDSQFVNQLAAVGRYVRKSYAHQLFAYISRLPMLLSLIW